MGALQANGTNERIVPDCSVQVSEKWESVARAIKTLTAVHPAYCRRDAASDLPLLGSDAFGEGHERCFQIQLLLTQQRQFVAAGNEQRRQIAVVRLTVP